MIAWVITLLGLVFMFPWARWLLTRPAPADAVPAADPVLLALTTLALSLGTLSLVLLWIGLLGIRIDWRLAAIICAGISITGWVVARRAPVRTVAPAADANWRLVRRAAVIVIAVICGLVLFNAIYWPFGLDDAITIYASFGKAIANSGQLPRGTLYETYPMLVPLIYAFTHQAAGWIDEYLAALIPALLSLGVIGVAYVLGRDLYNRATGLTAALLVAMTPMVAHWASASYVDLPAGFFYALSAVFLLRWQRRRVWSDALLAGIMAGLSAWTKNSGLLVGISIGGWIVYRWLVARREMQPFSRILRDMAILVAGTLVVAGPWYTRNMLIAGFLVPPTGWTWKADHSLANLIPYVIDSRYFIFGLVFTAGLLYTIWQSVRSRGSLLAPSFLLIFYVPFFVIWWALFSYDGRFLLILTAVVAVMGAALVQAIASRLTWTHTGELALVGAILLLALPAAVNAVDYKDELLHHPLMSDAEKHRVRLGPRYDMALYLRTLPTGSRVLTQELMIPYYADGITVVVGDWPSQSDVIAYDYWVLLPGDQPPDWLTGTPLHEDGGYRLYALH